MIMADVSVNQSEDNRRLCQNRKVFPLRAITASFAAFYRTRGTAAKCPHRITDLRFVELSSIPRTNTGPTFEKLANNGTVQPTETSGTSEIMSLNVNFFPHAGIQQENEGIVYSDFHLDIAHYSFHIQHTASCLQNYERNTQLNFTSLHFTTPVSSWHVALHT